MVHKYLKELVFPRSSTSCPFTDFTSPGGVMVADFTIDLSVPMVYIIKVLCAQNPEAYAMRKNIKMGLRNSLRTMARGLTISKE